MDAAEGQLSETKNPDFDYLSWNDLQELSQKGVIEIQNHSYSLHQFGERKGTMKKTDENLAEYIDMLAEDLSKMQLSLQEKAAVNASTFVYPFGVISEESLLVVKALGFQASFSCYGNKNSITKGDADCLFLLNRYNRPANVSTDVFMARMTK